MKNFLSVIFFLGCTLALLSTSVCAQIIAAYGEEEDLYSIYGDAELVSIATGVVQSIEKAPSVASVITAKDILATGATNIDEVLESVPGLHLTFDPAGVNPIYTFRGVYTLFNPQVLMLVNGIPISHLFRGDRSAVWGGMPVKAISRIEIIRGPGSAVYGADAFAGVINVITKSVGEIRGTEVGGRVGSYSTRDAWVLHGDSYGDVDVVFSLEVRDTDGYDGVIEGDLQSVIDAGFGTNASLAPGSLSLSRENLDTRLDITYQNWRFRAGLQQRRDFGNGAGIASALDPVNRYRADRMNVDLTYNNGNSFDEWDITVKLSHFETTSEIEEDAIIFPPGANLIPPLPFIDRGAFVDDGTFVNGMIGGPESFETHARFDISALFSGFDSHLLRFSIGYSYDDLYKFKEKINFISDTELVPGRVTPIPLPGGVIDVTDTPQALLKEGDRDNVFIVIQDIWSVASDWELTAGVRYDDYSDFGSTVNPRFALVWSSHYNLTTKLLYGRAFRAPSFAETRAQSNPVAFGNPDVSPEKMENIELSFDYDINQDVGLIFNVFYYEWDKIIRFVSVSADPNDATRSAQNVGLQTGSGAELEIKWKVNDNLALLGSYSHQTAKAKKAAEDPHNAPENQFYLRGQWHFMPKWHLTAQLHHVADRQRTKADLRSNIDDYTLVDVSIRTDSVIENLELALNIKNIFDKEAFEPTTAEIPDDLPISERSIIGEVSYKF